MTSEAVKLQKLRDKADNKKMLFDLVTNKYLLMVAGVIGVQFLKKTTYTMTKRAPDHTEWDLIHLRYRTIYTEQEITEPLLPEVAGDALQAGIIMAGIGSDNLEKIGNGIATVGKGLLGLAILAPK